MDIWDMDACKPHQIDSMVVKMTQTVWLRSLHSVYSTVQNNCRFNSCVILANPSIHSFQHTKTRAHTLAYGHKQTDTHVGHLRFHFFVSLFGTLCQSWWCVIFPILFFGLYISHVWHCVKLINLINPGGPTVLVRLKQSHRKVTIEIDTCTY